jgi:hypothetical protein
MTDVVFKASKKVIETIKQELAYIGTNFDLFWLVITKDQDNIIETMLGL